MTGEGWFEPGLPPWHGVWWLLSASGQPVPWAGTLITTTVGGKTVLAETYETGVGAVNVPVYTFSGDTGYGSSCSADPACQRAWPSVLTSGSPGDYGVPGSGIGEVGIPGGLTQVSWYGHPLYLFSHEELSLHSNGGAVPDGNGNDVKASGGTSSSARNGPAGLAGGCELSDARIKSRLHSVTPSSRYRKDIRIPKRSKCTEKRSVSTGEIPGRTIPNGTHQGRSTAITPPCRPRSSQHDLG